VVCFIGKGIWLQVERSLRRLRADGSDDDGGGLIARVTLTRVNADARTAKAEPEPTAFNATTDSAARPGRREAGDVSRDHHLLAVRKAEEVTDAGSSSPPSSLSTTAARRGGAASESGSRGASPNAKAARSSFAYGLQPYKAVHDVANDVRDYPRSPHP
jgi:hypothetical protein